MKTFHVLGLSHTRTTREFSACAFTQKVRLLCKMLHAQGHNVYHYGVEGSDPVCTRSIDVLPATTFERVHGGNDWRKGAFNIDTDTDAFREFTANAISAVRVNSVPGDFLLCPFGIGHKPIVDALSAAKLVVVESGIGYESTFAPFRVFESYPWMHFIYGKEGRNLNPPLFDAVIPNYYDLEDFPATITKASNYYFHIGRPTILKGLEIAIKAVEAVGGLLIAAGQGTPAFASPCMRHVGVLDIEQRALYMRHAIATFVPTYYVEPFGGTAVESMLCGTPVITTDVGAFSDTVIHGKTGYRCRTLEQFVWAARNVAKIKREDCMSYARANYSLQRVGEMYSEYFNMLQLFSADPSVGWYAANDQRQQLDWLCRY